MSEIRPATPADLRTVEAIVERAYSPYVSRIGRRPGPMMDDYVARIAAGQVHVIEQAGVVRGLLVLIAEDDALLLDNIAIDPGAQGGGLGRMLLQHAERSARDGGYRAIKLYTNEAMVENIALYGRLGYVETHRVEEKGLKRVYMAKTVG